MIILATIVQSCVYAIPAAVALAARGTLASRARRQFKIAVKTPTSLQSEKAAADFLRANKIDDVPVEKGDEYLVNAFDKKRNSVRLSPDAYGCVDAYSVARALSAGAEALAYRDAPEKLAALAKLDAAATWFFWGAFCALAFAIMGASLSSACVGYAALLVVWFNASARARFMKKSQKPVEEYLRNSGAFASDEIEAVLKTLAAIRVNP